ncbi:MAG: hypothetical protein OHK0013_34470 [Sandaracinaceae bacterium]
MIGARLIAIATVLVGTLCGSRVCAQPATTITIALGGDVIFDAPIEYVLRARARPPDDASAYDEIFEDLQPRLASADLAIVNLETPVGPRVRSRSDERDYPTFAAPPAFLQALARAGVDVVTVANNHAYDQGVAGLATTLGHVARAGLSAAGAVAPDRDGLAVVHARDVRVAVVSLTQGTNHRAERDEPESPRVLFFDEARLARLTTRARASADVVLVALHFTDTGDRLPTRTMARWCRLAAEAGADLVVGHGPHLPARVDWVEVGPRRVPLLYSLGNLVAAMRAEEHAERSPRPHVRDALLVEARLRVERTGVVVEALVPHAYWIDDVRGSEGLAPFTRPFEIAREVARRSDARSRALEARRARLAELVLGPHAEAPSHAPRSEPTTLASAGNFTPPAATPPPRPVSASAPSIVTPTAPEDLGVRFRCGAAIEEAVDERTLSAWVARLRGDPALALEVVSERCEGEAAALAERRARRAAGLVAIRGPSRARFTHRAGERSTGAAPRVYARITRR